MLLARALTASFLWAALACAASSAPGTRAAKPTEALTADPGRQAGSPAAKDAARQAGRARRVRKRCHQGGAGIVHAMNATTRL